MKNTAYNQARLPDDAPFMGQCQLHEASVFSVLGDSFLVNGPLGLVKAKRASSCLVAPDRGDLVLLCQTQASSYILAVLELCNEKADIVLPKESTFKGQDICLEADRDILFKGCGVRTEARHVEVQASLVRLCGLRLEKAFRSVQTRASSLVAMAGRAFGFFGRRLEKVDGVCETEAQRMRVSTSELMRVRSRSLDMRSKDSVILDGRNIRIG